MLGYSAKMQSLNAHLSLIKTAAFSGGDSYNHEGMRNVIAIKD